ncbi:phosphotransferase [bacterium]|nr:phosphotransferase [bacterium]
MIEYDPISTGGSDRNFTRLKYSNRTYIFLEGNSDQPAFERYRKINKFLASIGLGVPEIYIIDDKNSTLLMEDLGEDFLMFHLRNIRDYNEIKKIYKEVINELVKMHFIGLKHIEECKIVKNRTFGYDDFRWESSYFTKYFLEGYCGLTIINREELEKEHELLARRLDNEPRFFMHRDFQSQNLLLKNNIIRIIDYQDARMGLLQYDLASLLRDPYYVLDLNLQKELIAYYIDTAESNYEQKFSSPEFYETFNLTALQRNMQALGAYAYLSMVKKKEHFKEYIPSGLSQLKTSLNECGGFSHLNVLLSKITLG